MLDGNSGPTNRCRRQKWRERPEGLTVQAVELKPLVQNCQILLTETGGEGGKGSGPCAFGGCGRLFALRGFGHFVATRGAPYVYVCAVQEVQEVQRARKVLGDLGLGRRKHAARPSLQGCPPRRAALKPINFGVTSQQRDDLKKSSP